MSSAAHDLIPLHDERGWHDALVGLPHAWAHTHEHATALAAGGTPAPVLYCGDYDGVRVVCPLGFRGDGGGDWYSPYGFAGFASREPIAGFFDRWQAWARSTGAVSAYIVQHPALSSPLGIGERACADPRSLYLVDLRRPIDEVRKSFGPAIRRKLNRWDRAEIVLETDRAALTEAFVRLYGPTMRRAGAGPQYDFHPETLRAWAGSRQSLLFGVRGDQGIEAVTLFGYAPTCADYLFTASTESGRDHTTGLLWQALQALAKRGIGHVNLGGGIHADDGLARYKAGFAGIVRPLEAHRLVCDEARFRALCNVARTPYPPAAGSYFPPYHAASAGAAGHAR